MAGFFKLTGYALRAAGSANAARIRILTIAEEAERLRR
jgi:hypothetical protein